MNLKELTGISLDDIYWRFKLGKSKKRLTVFELRLELNNYIRNPVFFLSTGRCGTKWFSDLFNQNKSLMVLHSPAPSLAMQGKLAFEIISKGDLSDSKKDLLKEVFFAGREQFLRYSYKTDKRFIETNNYITFFAPILIELFPDAKFVHLYRHPGEFVRSGIRRKYYALDNSDDIKRISSGTENWKSFSQLEKTAWLWSETNQFIDNLKIKHPESFIDFNFNTLSEHSIISLLKFLDIEISPSIISKSLTKKSNIQKQGDFAKYENWDEEQKVALREICSELAIKYNYNI